jgi:Protein of unknown function (DUF565)
VGLPLSFAVPIPLAQFRARAFSPASIVQRRLYRRGAVPVAVAAGDNSSPDESGESSESGESGDAGAARTGDEAADVFGIPARLARGNRQNDLLERLAKITIPEDPVEDEKRRRRGELYLSHETQLIYLAKHFASDTKADFEKYLSNPLRLLAAGSIAILFGYFAATAASTIIGSVADWDPLAAAVLLAWTETFTRTYYRTKEKSITLRLLNAFKVGLIYGMCVDAFKLST